MAHFEEFLNRLRAEQMAFLTSNEVRVENYFCQTLLVRRPAVPFKFLKDGAAAAQPTICSPEE